MASPLAAFVDSPEVQAFAQGFPVLVAHVGASLGLLIAGSALHAWTTPWKELAGLRRGEPAGALTFTAAVIGLALPLAASLSASTSLKDVLIWGVGAVALQWLVFRLIDLLLAGLPERAERGELAAASLIAGARLCSGLVLAAGLTV